MSAATETPNHHKIHHGRNIARFRSMFRMKQDTLAKELGADWSQKKVSRLEETEVIEDEILAEIAAILKIPVEAIKSFDEQSAVNYFNTFHDNSASGNSSAYFSPNSIFNFYSPEEYKQLIEENKKLYEQLLASEKEKVALLQRLLDERK